MPDKLKELIRRMNEKGIPLPVARDPATGKGSVTFTLVAVSAGIIVIGLLNSAAQIFKGVDMESALYWNGMSLAAYLGRRMSGNGKNVEIESNKEQK